MPVPAKSIFAEAGSKFLEDVKLERRATNHLQFMHCAVGFEKFLGGTYETDIARRNESVARSGKRYAPDPSRHIHKTFENGQVR